ncbi:response regulator [Suilimivivens sp.]|uniref:response regulator n=1 Tax=Suilimivivens sp. TaxID=2981669 RepID=UPI0030768EEB
MGRTKSVCLTGEGNMLKVFLAEDEFIIREGIKNNIDWQAHGYEFCGEASDGELAFPLIQKTRPDILITDIKMPFVDGLALSRLVKKELPETEIIILSGYEEFDYAKEAIQIGVARYLLKPINGETLLQEIDSVAEIILGKQKEKEIREKYQKEMEENSLRDQMDLFQHLVTGDCSMEELLSVADKLDLKIMAPWYSIVLLKIQSMKHDYEEYSGSIVVVDERIAKLAEPEHVLIFDRALEGRAFLFKADSEDELLAYQKEYLGDVKEVLSSYMNLRYFGGIGTPVNRLREIPASFEDASHAFAHRYLVAESCILDSSLLMQEGAVEQEDFRISAVNPEQIDRTKMQEFLRTGDLDEVVYFVDEFFGKLDGGAMKSRIFRQYITMDAYFSIVDFLKGLGLQKDEIEAPDQDSSILQDEKSAMDYIVRIMEKALVLREKKASSRYEDVVSEVIHYIEDNYAQEELSLNLLASHVNFSPNHLSMIFSQQTGQTLIRYLTDYRMNRAKELLRCSSKKSSVISMEVGYKDPHYFSYLFKKTQGMTPTQYRGGRAAEGEDL